MRTAARIVVQLAAVVLVSTAATAGAGATAVPVQWLPSESFAGGKQADVRLDKAVTFWRAGVPLPGLFAELTRQTGVGFGFYPEDDANRRICVNVFLNADRPPTLREVMVQIGWVIDCPFAVSEKKGRLVYRVLSTSIGTNSDAAKDAHHERALARMRLVAAITKQLDEYRAALKLTREELIARYRGKNDLLLLNLLDPARRGAAEFVCDHPSRAPSGGWEQSADVDAVGSGTGLTEAQYTTADRAHLQAACGAVPPSVSVNTQIFQNVKAKVELQLHVAGGPDESSDAEARHSFRFSDADTIYTTIVSLPAPVALGGRDELALCRCLGEQIDPDRAAELVKHRDAELAAAARTRERTEEETGRTLSAEAEGRLGALLVPLRATELYPTWQLFEQLARVSGYHVVSDAFTTGGPALPLARGSAFGEPPQPLMPLLDGLTRLGLPFSLRSPEWEWGDAGTFLRFRSNNRDLSRAALLPEEFLAWLDGLLRPYLPRDPKVRKVDFVFPVDFPSWSQHVAGLTDTQFRFGASRNRPAPDDLLGNARQVVLEALLRHLPPGAFHFLGSLTEAQWASLQAGGLAAPADVTPDQMRLLKEWLAQRRLGGMPADFARAVITLRGGVPGASPGGPQAMWRVSTEVWPGGGPQPTAAARPQGGPMGVLPAEVPVHVDLSVGPDW